MPTRKGSSIEATESAVARTVPPVVLLMGVSGSGKSTVVLELHRRPMGASVKPHVLLIAATISHWPR